MKKSKDPVIEIIAVGSELLTPYFQDTNSLFITKCLNDLGFKVSYKCTVGDDRDELCHAVSQGISHADFLFTIGGLGPTEDDRTKEVVASVLDLRLVFKNEILDKIKTRFEKRGMSMPDTNKKQAYVMSGSTVLPNHYGTAPGEWVDTGSCTIILLPGPPHELEPMFMDNVYPRLLAKKTHFRAHRMLKITGLTESKVDSIIKNLYPENPDLRLTVLAHPGQIEIHISGYSSKSHEHVGKAVNVLADKIASRLGKNVFSGTDECLEEVVGKNLSDRGQTLSVAESCTGGLLGSRITDIPGSSSYFLAGSAVYDNKMKTEMAGVPAHLIEANGAVSGKVAQAMAEGIRSRTSSDFGLSITGIAGPGGESPDKPVGLVFTALSWEGGTWVERNLFLGDRKIIKFQSSQKALDMLRRYLLFGQTGPDKIQAEGT